MSHTDWQKIKLAEDMLHTHRIKVDIDYALMAKYGEVHIICFDVYEEQIRQSFASAEVSITSLHSIPPIGG